MANLVTQRWERYVPDLGDNRTLPEGERLELEVQTGLTSAQMQLVSAALQSEEADKVALLAKALEPHVRVRGGPHTINGADVRTLAEYVGAVASLADPSHLVEVTRALVSANSLTRDDEVFSERQSGGWVSTQRRAAAKAGAKTAGR